MQKTSLFQRVRDISIAKKLYFAVGAMALLIAFELLTLWFAIHTLSSVRAYVSGEGLWSKGQKDAVYHLQRYGRTYNENEYRLFREFMKVPLGDHKAREALMKPEPDLEAARQGFIEGRNHPDDIEGMIKLFRRFHRIYYINKAIEVWSAADPLIMQLEPIGEELHKEISSEMPSPVKIELLLDKVGSTNEKLTALEDEFSATLGEGSRWLENVILKLLFAVALTVEVTGLLLTISVSRSIQKGIDEIIRVSKRIAKGEFNEKATVYSKDEIGVLANSFNQMSEELGKADEALKDYSRLLEQSNSSLEQFAYVASHDLQEPLRTITNYVSLLEEKQTNETDEQTKRYMGRIVNAANRMRALIRDVLLFSKIGKQREIESVNCDKVVKELLGDMDVLIKESKAMVTLRSLPTIKASKVEIQQLFQNLISNAIKYRSENYSPVIEIAAEKRDKGYKFSVKDNGIGIDSAYKDKIFVIFQRLHNQNEYSGTGIGLATCKRIVELNGGTIWVESEPGKGSTFYFTLPKT